MVRRVTGNVIAIPTRQHRLLWIDDELDRNDCLIRQLSHDGFDVDVARSGGEGVARAAERDYALYLLDLHLPDVLGLDVLWQLRAANAEIPIILITGFATIEAAVEGMKAKVTNLLEKPVYYDDLSAALRLALPRSDPRTAAIAAAQRHLSDIAAAIGEAQSSTGSNVGEDRAKSRIVSALTSALSDVAVPRPTYAACARMLRTFVAGPLSSGMLMRCRLMATEAIEKIGAELPPDSTHPLEVLTNARHVMSEHELASRVGMTSRDLGIVLRATGHGFREWRTLLRIRPVLEQLASTNEHVAQLAFAAGYEHPSQVDRDFMKCVGMTPRRFREARQSNLKRTN